MIRASVLLIAFAFVTVTVPVGADHAVTPADPIINGDFELAIFQKTGLPHEIDAPTGHTVRMAGYAADPLAWNDDGRSGTTYTVFGDDDPFDGEVLFPAPGNTDKDTSSGHNLWQEIVSGAHTTSLGFDAYSFVVEAGEIPSIARVQVLFNLDGRYDVHPFPPPFSEGYFQFYNLGNYQDSSGRVELNAAEAIANGDYAIGCLAEFTTWLHGSCQGFVADLNEAIAQDELDQVRSLLGQTSISAHGFWNFNRGTADVVIDDVSIQGGLVTDELVAGNTGGHGLGYAAGDIPTVLDE